MSADAIRTPPQATTEPVTTTPAAESPQAPSPETTTPEEASPREARQSSANDSMRLRIGIQGGFGMSDLNNGNGLDDHSGAMLRLEVGGEFPFGDMFYSQANAYGSFAWGERGLGEGTTSSFNAQAVGANGRLGVRLLDDRLRIHAGVDIGAVHVGADECEDGLSCGVVHSLNAQLHGLDNWGINFAGELGVEIFHGVIGAFVRVGTYSGINPTPNLLTQPDNPPTGLNITRFEVGLSTDIMGWVRLFQGDGGASASEAPNPPASDTSDAGTEELDRADRPGTSPASETPEAPSETPQAESTQGLALIRENLAQVTGDDGLVAQIRQHAGQVRQLSRSYTAASAERRAVIANEAYTEARSVLRAYEQIQELFVQSNRERISSGHVARDELPAAAREVGRIRRARNNVRDIVAQAHNRARRVVARFNRGLGSEQQSQQIEFDLRSPAPVRQRPRTPRPAAGATPSSSRPNPRPAPTPAPATPASPPSSPPTPTDE